MIHAELEALLQGALDDTLTPEERDRLGRLMTESPEARARAAQLGQLTNLLDSLGPADAPVGLVHDVLTQISNQPHSIRRSTQRRGTPVNKRILFGLAAAAAVVLAVITYSTNPPATEGTGATIGAAQRAQAPQIAPSDVKLGDTSAQDVLQTEEWDQILKDEDLRTALQDESFRANLLRADYRTALTDEALLRGIRASDFAAQMSDAAMAKKLDEAALINRARSNADLQAVYRNQAFMKALRESASLRGLFARKEIAAALAKSSFQASLKSGRLEKGVRQSDFTSRLARAARQQ
jgi:hypothetical protein